MPDFNVEPWPQAVLATPRHAMERGSYYKKTALPRVAKNNLPLKLKQENKVELSLEEQLLVAKKGILIIWTKIYR